MKLQNGHLYRVRTSHLYHGGRVGKFEFYGGPTKTAIVLSDLDFPNVYFAVESDDIMGEVNETAKVQG